MKKLVTISALLTCTILFAKFNVNAQAQEPPLAVVDYMKVTPGMDADYVAGEAVWKKAHQNRITNGDQLSWQLYRRILPSGANAPYEYMTVTVLANPKAYESLTWDWDKLTKGMNAQEIFTATNIEKTRTIVSRSMFRHVLGAGTKSGKYLQIRQVSINTNSRDEYVKLLTDMNPTLELAIKNGKTLRRNIWEDMMGVGSHFAAVYDYANLTDALKNASGLPTLTEEYEKLNSGKKWKDMSEKINSLYTIANHELWELVMDTSK